VQGKDILQSSVLGFLYIMLVIAGVNLIFGTVRHLWTEKMANACVYDLRARLYEHFMRQDLGWFDHRENTSSVLVATMAEQTDKIQQVFININEFGTLVTMFLVIIIGSFVLEPYLGIAVVIMLPIVMALQYLQMSIEWEAMIKNRSVEKTESEIMLGDAINNYKTVQSFGHEDKIVGYYEELLEPAR